MKIQNKKLAKLLAKKEEVVNEGRQQYKVVEKEQQKLNKIGLRVQKVKDKIMPIMAELKKEMRESGELGEFEDFSTVTLKNGEIVLEKFDLVEEYKKQLRERYAEKEPTNEDAKE